VSFNQIPARQGLYDPDFEHDSCGVGFLCDIHGRPARRMVEDALEMLARMSHRGASGADPDSGDGAGILMQMPHAFLSKIAEEKGFTLPPQGEYGCGLVFLPQDWEQDLACRTQFEYACRQSGLEVLSWRSVPVRAETIGPQAQESMPRIEMVFAAEAPDARGSHQLGIEQRLFLARKRAESAIARKLGSLKGRFYVVSLSSKTLVYKGMLMPKQLGAFFPDLQDEKMESAICIVHSRYSTNTFPSWDRAQPFRFLAHNGEINTLKGNATWMRSREASLAKEEWGKDLSCLLPVIQEGGSDSQALDNALELLFVAGRSLPHAMGMLVPAAWEADASMDPGVRDFYRYQRCVMEAWDGPAALTYTDGVRVAASLDRNGLRPGRYLTTTDGRVMMASELGVLDIEPSLIESSCRLEPGHTLFIDTERGEIVPDEELKRGLARQAPYGQWLAEGQQLLPQAAAVKAPAHDDALLRALAYTREELEMILLPMAATGAEPIGSMGNDAPLAVLSTKPVPLFSYFRQLFAQVTNPPIDPLREGCVMSIETVIGPQAPLLSEGPEHARRLVLEKPVLSEEAFAAFLKAQGPRVRTISVVFETQYGENGFALALERACIEAESAIMAGCGYLVISDRGIDSRHAAIPSLMALGAVHQYLAGRRIRSRVALFVESAEPREVHHFCLLFGYGADAVVPYGAYSAIAKLAVEGDLKLDYVKAVGNYLHAVEHGLMKVLSKMGISTLSSYKAAQIFEAVGIGRELVERCFTGTPSRVGGIGEGDVARRLLALHADSYGKDRSLPHILDSGGFYRWRRSGELHAWNPDTVSTLQQAVRTGDYQLYKKYAGLMDAPASSPDCSGAVTLRSLLRFRKGSPVGLGDVESEESILRRFATGAMSYGSISGQAHETLARAMNRLGGMSNTGEGGEDPRRFIPLLNGDSLCSKVKQVASGRFGVTTHYLSNAKEIQIKIAQGAKPGEGGQLPGHKVSALIAKTRYTTEGVTLISPPPHHDIYSIEDLAQLILDLKNVNPEARISVKLVSEMGVGTVAAGVAKARAEMILISGGDGGTGASPLSSIKHAGLPWELGLSETHQTLVMNGLRDQVKLQCDGGMRTARDLAIACLLGADEFGFAAGALIAMGCVMLRHCHLNNCSMGVATQDERCAARFSGKPEHVENFMRFTARSLRELMAELGFRSLDEMRGRSDMLEASSSLPPEYAGLDFSRILAKSEESAALAGRGTPYRDLKQDFDLRLIEMAEAAVHRAEPIEIRLPIRNTDRAVGAMLSGRIVKGRGEDALPAGAIRCELSGTAGQSFGAWLCKGVQLRLSGFANDYVGKGLFGGVIAIRAPEGAAFESGVLIGNTALYGAISGELYVNGRAGERFCVRNSGATAVVEGVGDHACEYMTGGVAVVLGPTGRNFAAGMSGGVAYVYDPEDSFAARFNSEFADLEKLTEKDAPRLKAILERHAELSESAKAKAILGAFEGSLKSFKKVMPRDYRAYLEKKGEL
jgi:glutamate synthase (NADPH) large chain